MEGLQHMHVQGWLHQSLGPTSVVLSTVQERDVSSLQCCLRDLAFAVDARDSALLGGATVGKIWAVQTSPIANTCALVWAVATLASPCHHALPATLPLNTCNPSESTGPLPQVGLLGGPVAACAHSRRIDSR